MRAKRPGQNNTVNLANIDFIHQQAEPCIQRGLGKLDCPNIILRHANRIGNAIGKGAVISFDPTILRRLAAINHPIHRDDSSKIHLAKHLDDSRSTNASHTGFFNRRIKPIFIRPKINTDNTEFRFKRVLVNANPFNRPWRGALA